MLADRSEGTSLEVGLRCRFEPPLILLAIAGLLFAGAVPAEASDDPPQRWAPVLAQAAPAASAQSLTLPPVSPSRQTDAPTPGTGPSASAEGASFRDCADCPELVPLPAGKFRMGAASTAFDRPVHPVTIAQPFAIARYEITFTDWGRCFAAGGCKFRPDDFGWGGGNRPVINVSWYDAMDYVAWLSKATGHVYRLPSEAEWEYAARGGTTTPFAWGASVGTRMANCRDCQSGSTRQTLAVGSFPPNRFGLFDMAGNAAEWVEDCWNDNYRGAPQNGSAWIKPACPQHVLRGGSFDSTSAYVKPFARFRYDTDVRYFANGFRIVRNLP